MASRTRGRAPIATRARPSKAAPRRRSRSPRGEGERLREEILDATERLLIKFGDVDRVSIRAICEAVGVTPPSLYLHFPEKDALILAVCQRQFARLEVRLGAAIEGIDDPLEQLKVMGRTYVAFGVEYPEEYRILLMSKGEFSREDFETGEIPGISAFTHVLRAAEGAVAAGRFRKIDPFLIATGLWATMHGVTSLQISVHGFPLVGDDELVEHVIDVAMRGLQP